MPKTGLFFISDYRNVTCTPGRDPAYWILKELNENDKFTVYSTANNVVDSRCLQNIEFMELNYKGKIDIQRPLYNYRIYKAYKKVAKEVEIIHHCEKFQVGKGYNLIPILSDLSGKSLIIGPIHFPHLVFESDYLAESVGVSRILKKVEYKKRKHYVKIFKMLFMRSIDKADKVVVPNYLVKKEMGKYLSSKKIESINYGVDLSLYKKYSYKAEEGNYNLLYPSQAIERKGVEYLLEAISIVKKQIPEVELFLLSDGYRLDNYRKLSKDLDITENVVFCERLEKAKYLALLSQCRMMCQPTLSDAYGWTILDAMCLGVPVVTTTECGASELFENGEIGFQVEPKDAPAMAESILKLLGDVELCQEFSKNGLKKREFYDYKKIAPQYLELYERYI